jgi:hypothetical protein
MLMDKSRSSQLRVLWALILALFGYLIGCSLPQPLRTQYIGELGRFEFRGPDTRFDGIVIGVPYGGTQPDAVDYAQFIRDRTGAGMVIAYGFRKRRIPIDRPLVYTSPISWETATSRHPGSVYSEYKKLLRTALNGPLKFYVGVRVADDAGRPGGLEVVAAGFSFPQLRALKSAYLRIRDRLSRDPDLPKIDLALNPLDEISWNPFGVKNHGVLMLADRGLILRLPKTLMAPRFKTAYREIIARWIIEARAIAQGASSRLPEFEVTRLPYGRIDAMAGSGKLRGVVIAAPHGSFDWYTGELVEELSYLTLLPAVVTRGFTPTECDGWRINVNRPTERRYPTDTMERPTNRARAVYSDFSAIVKRKARGPLDLYIDIHQNGTEANVDVATVGVTRQEAAAIKSAYREIRDRVLGEAPEVPKVDFVIEPLDQIAIGAWATKNHGILRLAKRSFHFELPAQQVFYKQRARRAYTAILAELINHIVAPRRAVAETKAMSRGQKLQPTIAPDSPLTGN